MSNNKETLFENEHYSVNVQDITDANNKVSLGYSVRNKTTDVAEYESYSLVECLMFSKDMSQLLTDFDSERAVDALQH